MTLIIRPANTDDLPALLQLRADSIRSVADSRDGQHQWLAFDPTDRYLDTIRLRNLLVAIHDEALVGCAGLFLPKRRLIATFVHPQAAGKGIGRRLVAAIEDRAREYGLSLLRVDSALNATPFYQSCGYKFNETQKQRVSQRTGIVSDSLEKSLDGAFTDFQVRITALLQSLNIPQDYGAIHSLPMQPEARDLKAIGIDVFDREQSMLPGAAAAWLGMVEAARRDGVPLLPVSAFRTVDYQADLLRQKVARGLKMGAILSVSAAPGFSEHHSGRAIDIASSRENALEECFEATESFAWLSRNAGSHGFSMSYPRNNPHNIAFEPWHWAWGV